jgi:hypothetical protein
MAVRNSHPRYQNPYRYVEVNGVTYQVSVDVFAKGDKYSFAKKVQTGKVPLDPTKRSMKLHEDGSITYTNID